jgi:hypothetical protein
VTFARRDELARQMPLWTLVLASVGPSANPSYIGAGAALAQSSHQGGSLTGRAGGPGDRSGHVCLPGQDEPA